jgi:hypothetical protein
MVSSCGGYVDFLGLEELAFISDAGLLILAATPAAIGYVLWRVFVTNRMSPSGTLMLGLDENSATYTELYGHTFPWWALFTRAALGVATIEFGVFVYENFY